MPRGDKSKYTDKQERMAEHIEEGYEKKGVSEKEAERRAWATVNKATGGGNKPGGSGRGVKDTTKRLSRRKKRTASAKKSSRSGGAKSGARKGTTRTTKKKVSGQRSRR